MTVRDLVSQGAGSLRPVPPRLDAWTFVRAAAAGSLPAASTVTLAATTDSAEDRIFTFTASTASKNRNGWRVEPDAWDLASFRANPVVLWAHANDALPLGRALEVTVGAGNTLRARVQFAPKGLVEFVDLVVEYLRQRFLRGMSVGFVPLDWEWEELPDRNRTLVFTSVDLVELSIVTVPADAEALADERGTTAAGGLDPHAAIAALRRKVQIAELGTSPTDMALAVLFARRAILQATELSESEREGLSQAVWRLERRLRTALVS